MEICEFPRIREVATTDLGFVSQLARTQLALAEALSEENGKAGRIRAGELVAEAEATARRLEMGPLVTQIERLRGRASGAQAGFGPGRFRASTTSARATA